MFSRTAPAVALAIAATLAFTVRPADVEAASYSSWADMNYDFALYWGARETAYELYVVYSDGSEKMVLRSRDRSSVSDQMLAFSKGWVEGPVVDWYEVKTTAVLNWYHYSTYDTRSEANSNADWIEIMGLEADIRLIYRPSFKLR